MPQIYEVWNLDRYNAGLQPYKYSGSDYHDNLKYMGSSKHPNYKEHCAKASLVKYCLLSIGKDFVTPRELRNIEAMIQQKEDHSNNPDYYNMTNYCQPDPSNPITRNKISNTNKQRGIKPNRLAINNAHSAEACNKRSLSMRDYRWFYDPAGNNRTLCHPGVAPVGWLPGKHKVIKKVKKTRDQIKHNIQKWKIYADGVLFWEGENLKQYCRHNTQLQYLPTSPDRKVTVRTYIEYRVSRINNNIYLNDILYGSSQKELAQTLNVSESLISSAIKNNKPIKIISGSTIYTASRG